MPRSRTFVAALTLCLLCAGALLVSGFAFAENDGSHPALKKV